MQQHSMSIMDITLNKYKKGQKMKLNKLYIIILSSVMGLSLISCGNGASTSQLGNITQVTVSGSYSSMGIQYGTFNVINSPIDENNVEATLSNTTTPALTPTPANYLFNIAYRNDVQVKPTTVVNAVSPGNSTSYVFSLTGSSSTTLGESIMLQSNNPDIDSHISYAYSASCSDLTSVIPCTVTVTTWYI